MQINHNAPSLREYLEEQYKNVFDSAAIEAHIRDYVGFVFSDSVAPLIARQTPQGGRVLDIGCGFGSFVISARRLGLDAIGIEIAPFEIEYARWRLQKEMPELDPSSVYYLGDGHHIPFEDASFDAVTLWNVLEHVPDGFLLLSEVARLLKQNGKVFLICPNYAAFRREAHYLVPWLPLLPRRLASAYLRLLGREARFFETSIFYRTNWEIQLALKRLGMRVSLIEGSPTFGSTEIELFVKSLKERIARPELTGKPKARMLLSLFKRLHLGWLLLPVVYIMAFLQRLRMWWRMFVYQVRLHNPFVDSVILSARKEVG